MKRKINAPAKILAGWSELGHQPEKLPLLFLVPLVQVAWAEGYVQPSERRAILRHAADLKITGGHPGYEILLDWLEARPTDDFFEQAVELLREFLFIVPPAQRQGLKNVLLVGCVDVAQAAGDIGLLRERRPRINRFEREKLQMLGRRLEFAAI